MPRSSSDASRPDPPPSELPPAELEVLKVLWSFSPVTVREVMNRLHEQGRTLAYTTVQTFLTRLEQRGFVERTRDGVANLYAPLVSRDRVERSRLRVLLDELYDGSAAPLVLRLVAEQDFSADEINAMQTLIDSLASEDDDAGGRSKKGRGRRRGRRDRGGRNGRAAGGDGDAASPDAPDATDDGDDRKGGR